ncbi:MAG: hypothetical protein E6Q97_34295 [Desulfurellales bacterium]|nr:MAG: hypothetical protein E6Q97_34295 [Desulfurellales bacterium]
MTKPLPTIPGFDAPAGIGHNNPPEPTVDLDKLKELDGNKLYREGLLAPTVNDLKDEAAAFAADVTTEEGRKAIKSFAYRLTRSKNILDEKGKEINDTLRVHINAVDERRRTMRKELDTLIADIEKPLTQWEAAEAQRKNKLDADLGFVKNAIVFFQEPTLEQIDERIEGLKRFLGYDWQEYVGEGPQALDNGLKFLAEKRVIREQQIKDQEELASLRAAEAARQLRQPVHVLLRHVAMQNDPAFNGDRVETHSPYPDENGVRHAQPSFVAAKPSADDRKREINGWIVEAITSVNCAVPITEEQAKAIVIAIVRGQVPNVTITY